MTAKVINKLKFAKNLIRLYILFGVTGSGKTLAVKNLWVKKIQILFSSQY